MAKHIHIHLPARKTSDAVKHDPKNGQFTGGGGGAKNNPLTDRPTGGKAKSDADMKKHPQYTKEDHEYLKGKGWSNAEIHARWDAEKSHGNEPAKGKVKAPDVVGVVSNPDHYKKPPGSKVPLHVQKQRKLDEEKAAKANPHLHNFLGSGSKPAAESKPPMSERQAMLREMGSPRYSGRTPK
jgi:hypothetical protein